MLQYNESVWLQIPKTGLCVSLEDTLLSASYVSVLGLTGLSSTGVSAPWYLEQQMSDSYDYKAAFSLFCVCVCVEGVI